MTRFYSSTFGAVVHERRQGACQERVTARRPTATAGQGGFSSQNSPRPRAGVIQKQLHIWRTATHGTKTLPPRGLCAPAMYSRHGWVTQVWHLWAPAQRQTFPLIPSDVLDARRRPSKSSVSAPGRTPKASWCNRSPSTVPKTPRAAPPALMPKQKGLKLLVREP